jgi:hypothetical protein
MLNSRNIADLDPRARAIAEKQIFACAFEGSDYSDPSESVSFRLLAEDKVDCRSCLKLKQ